MTYAQLRALQSRSKYSDLDPKVYAALMGQIAGDPRITQSGVDPSWGSLLEERINTAVDATRLPDAFGALGGAVFGDTGREIFRDLPRSVVNLAPLALSGGAGLIGAGALGALQSWGDTEQAVPTMIGGALSAATPAIAKVGGGLGVQGMRRLAGSGLDDVAAGFARGGGQGVADVTERLAMSNLPRTGAELAGMVAGEQGALLGAGVAGDALSIAADPNRTIDELAQPAYWAAQALSNLPFMGFDVVQGRAAFKAGRAEAANARGDLQSAWLRDQPELSSSWSGEQLRLKGPVADDSVIQMGQTPEGWYSHWPPPELAESSPLAAQERQQQWDTDFARQRLLQEAAQVRPIEFATADAQAGAAQELQGAKLAESHIDELPDFTQPGFTSIDYANREWRKSQLLNELGSGDPLRVMHAVKYVLPDREANWLRDIVSSKIKQNVPRDQAVKETLQIAERWATSYLSSKRKTDTLGSTRPLDESLSMSSRSAHTTKDLNDWIVQRQELAKTDETVAAELDLVAKKREVYEQLGSSTGRSDRPQNEIYNWYRKWVDGEDKGATLETYLGKSEKLAAIPPKTPTQARPSPTNSMVFSRDAMPENQRDVADFAEAQRNVADDHPDKVAEITERIVRRNASRLREAIWPRELLDKPEYEAALTAVMEGLHVGDDAAGLAARLAKALPEEQIKALYNDKDFLSGVQRAMAAGAMSKKELFQGLDGAVDANTRAQVESVMQIKEMLDAERGEPYIVDKLRGMLEMFGADATEIARDLPTLARLWNFSKAFQGTDLAVLRKDGVGSMGLYARNAAGRRLVGIKTDRAQMMSWIMAHELTGHGLWDAADKGLLSPSHVEKLNIFRNNVQKMTVEERSRMMADAVAGLPRHLRNDPEVQKLVETEMGHADAEEVLANLNAIAALNLTSGSRSALRDAVAYLPKWFGDMYDVAAQYMRKMYDTLRGVMGPKERKMFTQHRRNMEAIMSESRANELAAAQLALFERGTAPGGLRDLLRDPDTAEANWQDILGSGGKELGDTFVRNLAGEDVKKLPHLTGAGINRAGRWLAHTLQPIVQFGGFDKNFRLFANQQLSSNQKLQGEITKLMGILGASYDGTTTRIGQRGPEARVAADEKVGKALNAAIMAVQKPRKTKDAKGKEVEYKTSVEDALKNGDAEIVKAMEGLTIEQRNLVLEAAANRRLFHRESMGTLRGLNYEFAAAQAATTSLHTPTGDPLGISYEPVYNALKEGIGDYAKAPKVDGKLDDATQQALEQQITQRLVAAGHKLKQGSAAAASFVEMLKNADKVYARQMQHDSYVNESRHGDYKVSFVVPKDSEYGKFYGYDEGEHGYVSASTLEDAEFMAKLYEGKGLSKVSVVKPTDFEAQEKLKLSSDIEDIIKQETENLQNSLIARGLDAKTVEDTMEDFNLLHHINRDRVATRMGTLTITRRFAPGRESLNMGEQQVQHLQSLLRGAQRRINEAVFKGMTRDKDYHDSAPQAAVLTSWRNNMAPDTKLTQGIGKFGYFYALAMNMPNYAQEWVQGLTGFPAKLIDEGASWTDAYKYVTKAQKDTFLMQKSKKFLKGGELDTSHLPADEAAFMKEAMERGVMGNGMLAEVTADTLDKQYRAQKVALGWLPDTVSSRTGQAADAVFNGVTRLHSKFTAGSTSTALLAAYRHLRAKGLDKRAAMDKAYVLFNEGMMIGGRYNRPAGLWDAGSWRPVSAMISALQSFTSNTIASTINYARRAADGKLPKGERQASAKALANQVLVQTALAGVMGLPLVGPLMALAEKEVGFDLQAELAKLAANMDDPVLGATVSNIALRGLFRGFGGPDIGARYGLGNVMGLNENDGFSFENFFGPVGSAAGRAVSGLGMLMKGEPLNAAAEMAPVALRKPLKLWSDDWQFRSKDGNLLLEDATATEKAMYMLGLQPQRLNQAREAFNMTKRAREREHQQELDFSREVADTLQGGDTREAQDMLRTKAEEDGMDYQDLVERVVNAIETRTFQSRPTREGTRQTAEVDAAIARGYGQMAPIDEGEREQFKAELAVLLGGEPNEKRLREAAVIDEMRRANPFLTVRQARILLEKQKRQALASSAGLQALTAMR